MTDPEKQPNSPVASPRHTAIILFVLILVTLQGLRVKTGMNTDTNPSRIPLYLTVLASEWAIVYGVWRGIRPHGITLNDLVGGRWKSARDVAMDIFFAALFWFALFPVLHVWEFVFPHSPSAPSVNWLLPHGNVEIAFWIVLSISAGIAEEIVFRGYLQRQFSAWTRSAAIGIALQALIFGVTHGYQGVAACIRITILGAMFGMLAYWRKSLRPGMIAHAWTDIIGAFMR